MKKIYPFIILIVCAIIVVFLLERAGPKEVAEVPFSLPNGQYCFSRTQIATETEPYTVEEHIVLHIVGNGVSGTKEGTQSGPDMTNGYQGDLTGVIEGENMELTYSYTIEGSKNKELEVYEVGTDSLVKMRWALVEEDGTLVPDRIGEPKRITYTKEECAL